MVGFVKVKWISLFLMIIYIKYIKLIFLYKIYKVNVYEFCLFVFEVGGV